MWLGRSSRVVPPQVCVELRMVPLAERERTQRVRSTLPLSAGLAESSSAATPAVWGLAMLVPLKLEYRLLRIEERIPTPGAATSGFSRLLPSIATGPREEKLAM